MFASLLMLASGAVSGAELAAACRGRDGWAEPAPPARIHGAVYDVGTCGITALLVTTPKGHILIDGGPAAAAPLIARNIERLGFKLNEVKYILNSHEHGDHAGGIAELQRRSGATLVARAPARRTLETGVTDAADPQAAVLERFPVARVGRPVGDGGEVRLGGTVLTAHATPGHAAGSTSWTWRSCERAKCVRIVYADSLSAVSGERYRFSAHPAYVAAFRASIAKVGRLPCDLLVTPHPSASRLFERLSGAEPLIDRTGCRHYAKAAEHRLDARLAEETK